jgi:23S rRNA (guanosine2251-2'-O)-methyltransferase|tara:strand:+ start:40810 stop:41589 length:780 start_codon:yes stop_codon:yes gene_type:complete
MTHRSDLIVGFHAVQSLLKANPSRANSMLVLRGRRDQRLLKTIAMAEKADVEIKKVTGEELDKLVDSARHQGVVLFADKGKVYDERWMFEYLEMLEHKPLILILDGITDPHNLGACLRSADAAGVDTVIVPRDKSCGLTPVVRKVASGGADTVPFVLVTNLSRTMEKLRDLGVWIVGTAGEADQGVSEIDFTVPTALVMGSEGRGLRRLTRECCDYLANIPMAGSVASLNVSVATGVVLYEVVRQRSLGGSPTKSSSKS